MKERKKAIAATIAWSAAVAFVMIRPYWLVYVNNPWLFDSRVLNLTQYSGGAPLLGVWDLALVFLFSTIAGAVILNLETIIYSVITSVVLSFIFAVTWASLFIWFNLGMGESLAIVTPGVSFLATVETTIEVAFMNVLRIATVIVPLICFIGVFVGAFVGSYFQPSAES
jgi:hypothetical protein